MWDVGAADNKEEAPKLIEEAIESHIQSLRDSGQAVPGPQTISEFVEVNAA